MLVHITSKTKMAPINNLYDTFDVAFISAGECEIDGGWYPCEIGYDKNMKSKVVFIDGGYYPSYFEDFTMVGA